MIAISDSDCIRLGDTLKLVNAGQMRQQLLAALEVHPTVEIDATALRELDLAGVQLLVAAGKSAAARGCRLRLVGAEETPLAGVLADAGFGATSLDRLLPLGAE